MAYLELSINEYKELRGSQLLCLRGGSEARALWWRSSLVSYQILTVIGLIALNETPAVDIDHLTAGAVLTAQHVVATDSLAKCVTDFRRPGLLLVGQARDKSMKSE